MKHTFSSRCMSGLLLTAVLMAGCIDDARRTVVAPLPPAPPPAPAPPPSITSITPSMSSTAGGALMRIVGSGFQSGAVAIFGEVRVHPRFTGATAMSIETPPQQAGTIDIAVANPDGQLARYAGGHTYVAPETFDPNGEWLGESLDGSHRLVGFTIQSGKLLRAHCIGLTARMELPVTEAITVTGGTFSVFEIMAGRIVSAGEMFGTMQFQECSGMSWRASKR